MDHSEDGSNSDGLQVDVLPRALYKPLSFPVIALLMPTAVFGVLARLGLVALMTYNGESVFPLAYVQALGCLIMGFCLRLKEPLDQLYVQLRIGQCRMINLSPRLAVIHLSILH